MTDKGTLRLIAALVFTYTSGCGGSSEQAMRGPSSTTSVPASSKASGPQTGVAMPAAPSVANAGAQAPLIVVSRPVETAHCRAGHYIGKFFGDYRSAAWLGGEEIIMFATADVGDRPGFEFWLESVEQPCTAGQEFCPGAVVKGGKLRGNVTPFASADDPSTAGGFGFSVRFEIDLTGELDCITGKFRGRLENGCYDILSVLYRFDGTIESSYTLSTSVFGDGTWQVAEMLQPGAAAPTTPLGGSGQWSAQHMDDSAAPSGPGMGLCSGASGFDTPQP